MPIQRNDAGKEGWPTAQIVNCAWVKGRLNDRYGVVVEDRESHGTIYPTVTILKLKEVMSRIVEADIEFLEGHNIPYAVQWGMRQLGIATIMSLQEATRSALTREQRLKMLSSWFNGGSGLPRDPKREKVNTYLTHPSLLDLFLNWVVDYLSLHDTIDGRINRDNERLINCARNIRELPDVRRF
jgi:hypothetical protein